MYEFNIPYNYFREYSGEQISEAVKKIGSEITWWAERVQQETGQDVLAIPVLRGGIFFFADLVREIRHSVEIAPARAWAYEPDEVGAPRKEVGLNLDGVPAAGRSILIIDDVCDSGRTLKALTTAFLAAGAREVKSAVLVRRVIPSQVFVPDWAGFEYHGEEWFVGYGMDEKERWRNLPSIFTIRG